VARCVGRVGGCVQVFWAVSTMSQDSGFMVRVFWVWVHYRSAVNVNNIHCQKPLPAGPNV